MRVSDLGRADSLPSPSRGGAGGEGRDADRPVRKARTSWERDALAISTPTTSATARSLRKRLTPPERRLWWHLRHTLALAGTHFRRQVAIGRYIADFCCLAHRLVVEVDGGQHGFERNVQHDMARTRELEARGFRVIRFSNREVMLETNVVIDTILAACGPTPPTPGPSPRGGGKSAAAAEVRA